MAQTNQQPQQGRAGSFLWGKVAGMIFATGIPAGLVIVANKKVFPDSAWLAIGMVVATFGIAAIFAVASGYATGKVQKYVLFAALGLSVELAANVVVHWIVAREVSAAKQATTARHEEEDRVEARRESEAKRQREFLDKQRELLAEQKALAAQTARQLQMEAIRNDSAIRLGIRAPRGARITTPQASVSVALPAPQAPEPEQAQPAAQAEKPKTVQQVLEEWYDWLIALAAGDLLTSVIAFGICALLWECDRNHNGIPDHLEHLYLFQQLLAQHAPQVIQAPAAAIAPVAHAPAPIQTVAQVQAKTVDQPVNGSRRP